jgi:DNA-binding CsgD family transcriptional regulator
MQVVCPGCGKVIAVSRGGRRRVTDKEGFNSRASSVLAQVRAGELSLAKAARELGVSKSTVKRLVNGSHVSQVSAIKRRV